MVSVDFGACGLYSAADHDHNDHHNSHAATITAGYPDRAGRSKQLWDSGCTGGLSVHATDAASVLSGEQALSEEGARPLNAQGPPTAAIRFVREALTKAGVLAAHPSAFVIVFGYVCAWLLLSPGTFDWHAIATVATWLMTLLIQRAEHRDTQAIHAKLDELLVTSTKARNELTLLDEQEPEDIEEHRAQERQDLR